MVSSANADDKPSGNDQVVVAGARTVLRLTRRVTAGRDASCACPQPGLSFLLLFFHPPSSSSASLVYGVHALWRVEEHWGGEQYSRTK